MAHSTHRAAPDADTDADKTFAAHSTPTPQSFPQHISPAQISHALCTVLAYLSDTDDAAAYYVVQRLEDEVRERAKRAPQGQDQAKDNGALDLKLAYADLLPFLNLVLLSSALRTVRAWILDARAESETGLQASSSSASAQSDGESQPEVTADANADTSGSGETTGADSAQSQTPHLALCTRTFKALDGMDDTARQEGVRWWLEHREEFGV